MHGDDVQYDDELHRGNDDNEDSITTHPPAPHTLSLPFNRASTPPSNPQNLAKEPRNSGFGPLALAAWSGPWRAAAGGRNQGREQARTPPPPARRIPQLPHHHPHHPHHPTTALTYAGRHRRCTLRRVSPNFKPHDLWESMPQIEAESSSICAFVGPRIRCSVCSGCTIGAEIVTNTIFSGVLIITTV